MDIYTRCLRCNRILKTTKAKIRGYGDCCWKIHKEQNKHKCCPLFNVATSSIQKSKDEE